MKRLITLFLSVLLIISTLPVCTFSVAAADVNLALGKPVTANCDRGDGYKPSSVTDGDNKTVWCGPAGFVGAAVTVDLEKEYVITEVVLHNRSDTKDEHYRRNVNIEFSNSPDFEVKESVVAMSTVEAEFGVPVRVKAPSTKPYRYVRVIKTLNTTHVVAELEVYGYEYDPNALRIGKDVTGTELEGPVTLLRYLQLVDMKNEMDDIFGADSVMTRGQAIHAIMNAFAKGMSFEGESPFLDVPKDYAYYNAIATAYHLGYITGDDHSSFRPNEYVTLAEFLVMTFRAIVYQQISGEMSNMDMSRILSQTKTMDFLKNTGLTDYSAFVSRGAMAQIFYNALLAPGYGFVVGNTENAIYEKDSNLLYKVHNMILTQGVVEENRISTLDGTTKNGENAVEIGGKLFYDPKGTLDAYLGKQVIVASNLEYENEILFAWQTGINAEVVIPAKRLFLTDSDCIKAYDAEYNRTINYKLAKEYFVVKNDVAAPGLEAENNNLLIHNGRLRLLDNNKDGVYEIVFVEEYELHYVKNGFTNNNTLTIINSNGERQELLLDSLVVTNPTGSSISAGKVTADTVVQLFQSEDKTQNRIILFEDPLTGKLTKSSKDSVDIDETSYFLSLAYQNAVRTYNPIIGEKVSVFVDEAGEIIWIERDLGLIESGWTIAFSHLYNIDQGIDRQLHFRMFTIQGEWKELSVADKINVDGTMVPRETLINLVRSDTDKRFTGELVRYQLDAKGNIKAMDTKLATSDEEDGTLHLSVGTALPSGECNWTSNSYAFWKGQTMVGQGKADTPVFVLATAGGSYPNNASYDGYFRVVNMSSMVGSHVTLQRALIPYMEDEFGYPTCFVTVQDYPIGTASSSYVTSSSASYLIVDNISKTVNDEGEIVQKITGYNIDDGSVSANYSIRADENLTMVETGLLYQEEASCFDDAKLISDTNFLAVIADPAKAARYLKSVTDINIGDVVRYQLRGDSVFAVERIFNYDQAQKVMAGVNTATNNVWFSSGNNPTYYQAQYRHQIGTFSKVDGTAFSIETLAGNTEVYTSKVFSKFYTIDFDSRLPKVVEVKDLSQFEGADVQVYVYSYTGNPLVAIVYPY